MRLALAELILCCKKMSLESIRSYPTISVRMYTDKFLNARGKKIQCYYWEPSQHPRAMLLLSHGYTDHAMMYESVAQEMAKRGFFVFAHDHAGHGKSEGERAHVASVHHLVSDSVYHIEKMRKKFPGIDLFMCGHSMGGAVTLLTALRKSVGLSGIVVLAPALAANPETASNFKIAAARIISHILPHFPLAHADVSLATRNQTQIQKMNADPLRHHGYFKAVAAVSLLSAGEEILRQSKSLDAPYLILHGDNDKVCDIIGSRKLHEGTSSTDKTFVVYPGAYHSLLQEPDDVASDVFDKIVQWLEERA